MCFLSACVRALARARHSNRLSNLLFDAARRPTLSKTHLDPAA